MHDSLQTFIAHARQKGMDHSTIRMLLLSAGWKEKDIAQALSAQGLDMPVPVPPDRGGARDAFFHLLNFAALYTSLVSLVILFFTYINDLLPDPALGRVPLTVDRSGIRWSMAAIFIAVPLFYWLSLLLQKEMWHHTEKVNSGVRRWLTYLTLFLAALALMGDAIALVSSLLEGELSARFLLKVLVILVLAGLTFTYYFIAIRDSAQRSFHQVFAGAAGSITLLALVWGFVLAGSPGAERLRKFDERRLEALRAIQNEVMNLVYEGRPYEPGVKPKPLPLALEEVAAQAQYQRLELSDPETGEPYEYRLMHATRFELCATFAFPRTADYDVAWDHGAGHHCYAFDVTDLRGPQKSRAPAKPLEPAL